MLDGRGSTLYGYDTVGQLLSEGELWPNDTVNDSYQNRLRMSMSVLAPDGCPWIQNDGCGPDRRLTSIASPAGAFEYTVGGSGPANLLVAQLAWPNGAAITNT
jgi:hypothetical protein